ncbi:MAG: putative RNA methylase [Satyrvirus sp.]|uniref:Putative RNA methylase n=1 Tax=Satyrvirus sp. TaxID=2487771 RepID=A0A3G5AJJ3_9VIRU|nr:MAG: putative RNA methylase [Satyrvirus sp.]
MDYSDKPKYMYCINKNNNYKKIISLKKLIFPPIEEEKVNQLMIDDESIKYITFASSAQEITNIIMNSLTDFPCPFLQGDMEVIVQKWNAKSLNKKMKYLVITDMTAGVGGNVINFAKYFKYINAIEIDQIRCNYLNKNIRLYGYDNVNCYNQDSLDLLINNDDIIQDIIFFDPPWGGKDYKLFNNLRLMFGKYSVEDVCHLLFKRERNKMIVLKLPNNYDFGYMLLEMRKYRINKFVLDRMTIIILKNYVCN